MNLTADPRTYEGRKNLGLISLALILISCLVSIPVHAADEKAIDTGTLVKFENGTELMVPKELPVVIMPGFDKMPEPIQPDYIIIPTPDDSLNMPVKNLAPKYEKKYLDSIGDIELKEDEGEAIIETEGYTLSGYSNGKEVTTSTSASAPNGGMLVLVQNHRDGTVDKVYIQETDSQLNYIFVKGKQIIESGWFGL